MNGIENQIVATKCFQHSKGLNRKNSFPQAQTNTRRDHIFNNGHNHEPFWFSGQGRSGCGDMLGVPSTKGSRWRGPRARPRSVRRNGIRAHVAIRTEEANHAVWTASKLYKNLENLCENAKPCNTFRIINFPTLRHKHLSLHRGQKFSLPKFCPTSCRLAAAPLSIGARDVPPHPSSPTLPCRQGKHAPPKRPYLPAPPRVPSLPKSPPPPPSPPRPVGPACLV